MVCFTLHLSPSLKEIGAGTRDRTQSRNLEERTEAEARDICPGEALHKTGLGPNQSLTKKMCTGLLTGQSDGDNSSIDIPSPQMTQLCIKLTKQKNPAQLTPLST